MIMEYDLLLERAFDNLPNEIQKKSIRLKIPKPIVMTTGKKTTIKNFYSITSIINRDPKHVLKFLTKELASPGYLSDKTAIFQGNFSNDFIFEKINYYIKNFVICKECNKPDTELIKEKNNYVIKCEACGTKRNITT